MIIEETPFQIGSSAVITIVLAINLWMSSIDLVFHSHSSNQSMNFSTFTVTYIVTLGVLALDWTLMVRKQMEVGQNTFSCSLSCFLKNYYKQIICLSSTIYKIILGSSLSNSFFSVLEIISLTFFYFRFKEVYQSLRLISYSLYY